MFQATGNGDRIHARSSRKHCSAEFLELEKYGKYRKIWSIMSAQESR